MQRLSPLESGQAGLKINFATNMRKTIPQVHWSYSMQKTDPQTGNI